MFIFSTRNSRFRFGSVGFAIETLVLCLEISIHLFFMCKGIRIYRFFVDYSHRVSSILASHRMEVFFSTLALILNRFRFKFHILKITAIFVKSLLDANCLGKMFSTRKMVACCGCCAEQNLFDSILFCRYMKIFTDI